MSREIELAYYKELIFAWDSYDNLLEVNKQLVQEIRRLNTVLKGALNET